MTASQTVPVSGGLGRGEGSAVDIVDAVVVAGEALDDESLEGGIVPAGLGFGGELGELRRRGPRLNAGVSLLRFGRLHGSARGLDIQSVARFVRRIDLGGAWRFSTRRA